MILLHSFLKTFLLTYITWFISVCIQIFTAFLFIIKLTSSTTHMVYIFLPKGRVYPLQRKVIRAKEDNGTSREVVVVVKGNRIVIYYYTRISKLWLKEKAPFVNLKYFRTFKNFILSLTTTQHSWAIALNVAPYRARRLLTNMTNGVATLG